MATPPSVPSARAAATAWFPPLPPWCCANVPPTTVRARLRQAWTAHHEVDVDRPDHDEGLHACRSTSERSRWTKTVHERGGVDVERHEGVVLRFPAHRPRAVPDPVEIGDGHPTRPRAVGLDLHAGGGPGRHRRVDREGEREWIVHARAAEAVGAFVELDVERHGVAQERPDRRAGRRRHHRCEPLARELHLLRDVQADTSWELGLGPPGEPAEHRLRGVGIDPGVRLGGRRGVAALCVRAAHQGEPRKQVGKTRLFSQRERHVRERARGDQQDLARPIPRRLDEELRRRSRGRRPGRNRQLGMPEPSFAVHHREGFVVAHQRARRAPRDLEVAETQRARARPACSWWRPRP